MKKGMKKFVSLLLAAMMVVSMVAFSTVVYADANPDFKMGVILVGDETDQQLDSRCTQKQSHRTAHHQLHEEVQTT